MGHAFKPRLLGTFAATPRGLIWMKIADEDIIAAVKRGDGKTLNYAEISSAARVPISAMQSGRGATMNSRGADRSAKVPADSVDMPRRVTGRLFRRRVSRDRSAGNSNSSCTLKRCENIIARSQGTLRRLRQRIASSALQDFITKAPLPAFLPTCAASSGLWRVVLAIQAGTGAAVFLGKSRRLTIPVPRRPLP